ncbi:hypothetical protein A8C32_06960 [Flavivirga aquatica]|uniref:Uncharacterized protein n=1 Tax=Flavivirga aquatica TaxID=1849968 RepID=A0A1E5SIH9_9FLAO|nr:hypothetical protein [Flavivirga aquatica]OEJ98922.1 hypothetical protein A8C32_06960 [Flavivirga aquatica]
MKKLLNTLKPLILLIVFTACSSDDDLIEKKINYVSFVGQLESGNKLLSTYEVSGFTYEDYKTANVKTKWWKADDINGTNAVMIDGATELNYMLTDNDISKFIAVELAIENTINTTLRSPFKGPVDGTIVNTEIVANAIDTQLFNQINTVNKTLVNENIWKGFSLTDTPMYLIHKNANGDADRGFIINPQSTITNAINVPNTENGGLNVVRYDTQVQEALSVINSENGLYDFDFNINGNSVYYIQVYTDIEVEAGSQLATYPGGFFDINTITVASIDFIIHEPFHSYQDTWTFSSGANPTLNQEILELRALAHQIFKNFPNGNLDTNTLETKLKQYVAIIAAETVITGDDSFISGEKLEGTPRYVEKMALRKSFAKRADEPFITGSITDNDYGIVDQATLYGVIDALQYEIGASAYFALKSINNNALEEIEAGKSQYQSAKDFFKMSQSELDQQLQNAKNSVDFSKIQMKVTEWLPLL